MAEKSFLVNINLNKNQLLNTRLQNLASVPTLTANDAGYLYWSTVDNTAYFWTGTMWKNLEASSYVHPNHTGDVTSLGDGATTIGTNVVTNAKLAQVGTSTIKGRITAGTGNVEDLTPAQVRTIINVEDGADVTDTANVAAAGAVMETDYDAFSVLVANVDNTPLALTLGTNTVLGRIAGNIQAISIDNNLSSVSASDDTLASAKAIKSYVDTAVTGALVYQGGYDAATNTPDLDSAPSSTIKKGWTYTVTAAGTFFSTGVQIGDMLVAEKDAPTLEADWTIVNKNIPDIVSASETAQGIIELATAAEVTAGTDAVRAITPANLINITKLGTIGTGTWQGTIISPTYGGTGVNNGSKTITLGGNLTTSGAYNLTLTLTGNTNLTLPVSGPLTAKYATDITGNGSAATFAITHNLGTLDIVTFVKEVTTNAKVEVEEVVTNVNTLTINFNVAPAVGKVYRVVVVG